MADWDLRLFDAVVGGSSEMVFVMSGGIGVRRWDYR